MIDSFDSPEQVRLLTRELVALQDQLAAIHMLAEQLGGGVDLKTTVRSVVTAAHQALGVERAGLLLALPERPLISHNVPENAFCEASLEEFLSRVEKQGDYCLESGPSGAPPLPQRLANRLLLPLSLHGKIHGVLVLQNDGPTPFTTPGIKLAEALVTQARVPIEQQLWAEAQVAQAVLAAQLDMAREVQRVLLPPAPPPVAGIEVWAAYDALHEVGGDFYDLLATPHDGLLLSIGDVCGKGVAAAMLMTMTRTTLRNGAGFLQQNTPAHLLAHANDALYDDFAALGMFASLFVAQVAPQEAKLTYANAGHAPVIYCPAGGDARLLPAGQPALGLLRDAAVNETVVDFSPGDLLVVATDGYLEALNPEGEQFGYDRLLEAVTRCAGQTAASIGAIIQAVVATFGGSRPRQDDQTLLVIKGVPG